MFIDPIYYCSYVDNMQVTHKCGSYELDTAIRYAKNLSTYKHRITVTAHYANGGCKKIGFAEKGEYTAL